jgi:hypothetical protein
MIIGTLAANSDRQEHFVGELQNGFAYLNFKTIEEALFK